MWAKVRNLARSLLLGAVLSVVCLTSCAPAQPKALGDLSGLTVSQFVAAHEDENLIVYDLSKPVVNELPAYTPQVAGRFVVIAWCWSQSDVILGVISRESLTAAITDSARRGEYNKLLAECA